MPAPGPHSALWPRHPPEPEAGGARADSPGTCADAPHRRTALSLSALGGWGMQTPLGAHRDPPGFLWLCFQFVFIPLSE